MTTVSHHIPVPLQITGLNCWMDASDGNSLVTIGNILLAVKDKSAYQIDVIQNFAANQPFTLDPSTLFHGVNTIDFSDEALSFFLTGDDSDLPLVGDLRSIYLAAEALGTKNKGSVYCTYGSKQAGRFFQVLCTEDEFSLNVQGGRFGVEDLTNDFFIFTVITRTDQLTGADLYLNGQLQSSALTNGANRTINTLSNELQLGSSQRDSGQLGEMLIYRGAHSDNQRERLEKYLGDKWGLVH